MTEEEKKEYETLYAAVVALMEKHKVSILEKGNPYPKPTGGHEAELSPKLKEWLRRSGVFGAEFSGKLPHEAGLSKGERIPWALALKTLQVDREIWAVDFAHPEKGTYELIIGYFGAVGLYPNVKATDQGEVEALVSVQDWTNDPLNPRIHAAYRAVGAGKYRFCFDEKPLCEVTYGKGIHPRATVIFSKDFEIVKVRVAHGLGLAQVALITLCAVCASMLIGGLTVKWWR